MKRRSSRWIPEFILVALVAGGGATTGVGASWSAAVAIEEIAKVGETPAGLPAAKLLIRASLPIINDAGTLAFSASLQDSGSGEVERGIARFGSAFEWMAIDGQDIGDPLFPFGGTSGLLGTFTIDEAGELTIQVTDEVGEGIWKVETPLNPVKIARQGEPSPFGANYVRVPGLIERRAKSGELAFVAYLDDESGDSFLAIVGEGNEVVPLTSDPNGPEEVVAVSFPRFTLATTAEGTALAFNVPALLDCGAFCSLSGELRFAHIPMSLQGLAIETIARSGDPSPGVEDATFGNFGDPAINGNSEMAFVAEIEGPGTTEDTDTGLWVARRAGGIALVGSPNTVLAREGNQLPGFPIETRFSEFGPILLNDRGEVAFVARTTNGLRTIWIDRGAGLVLVAADGAFAPIDGSTWEFGAELLLNDHIALNALGQLVFHSRARLENDDLVEGLWVAQPDGTVEAAVLETDLPGSPGLNVFAGSGGNDGRIRWLNDYGQIAMNAGSSMYRVTIPVRLPEPAHLPMSLLAALTLVGLRIARRDRRAPFPRVA